MKKSRAKLTALILALGCCAACVGAGIAVTEPQKTAITVNAEEATVHTLGELAVHNNSSGANSNTPKATQLYMKIASGAAIPYPDGKWETEFALESGAGWKLNGTDVTAKVSDIESTNNGLFVDLTAANVQVGDILSVEGTFYSADVNAKYVVTESSFTWNGTAWEKAVTYTTHTIGSLTFHDWTTGSNHVYFKAEKSIAVPQDGNSGWTATFLYKDGVGVTVNGVQVDVGQIKFPSGSMFVNINNCFSNSPKAPVAGDILTVGGTFYNNELALQYVITESTFKWDGSTWVLQAAEPEVPPTIEYTTYTATKLGGWIADAATYLYSVEGDAFPKGGEDWSTVYTFEAGSGDGMTYNGEPFSTADIKQPGDFYIGLGKTPATGDIFTIDGTYYNETKALKFVFVDCKVQFDGTKWVEYVEEQPEPEVPPTIEYTTYTVTKLGGGNDSTAEVVYLYTVEGDPLPKTEGDWAAVYTFEEGSGDGVLLNDTAISPTIKLPGDLYVPLGKAAAEGDIVTIDGTYYNEAKAHKFVFVDCKVQFKDGKWVTYVESANAIVHELGELDVNWASDGSKPENPPKATQLYMKRADNVKIPYPDGKWETEFALESGAGWKLNGETITPPDLESTDAGLFVNLASFNVQPGDILSVEGTFYSADVNAKYVIAESKFTWTGSVWTIYTEVNYTTHEIGSLKFKDWTADQNYIYLKAADGTSIPKPDDGNNGWTATFNYKNGVGVTVNGKNVDGSQIKFPMGDMFVNIAACVDGAPVEGDVLVVGGTFYNVETAMQYIIEETTFTWNGRTWVLQGGENPEPELPDVEFTEYDLGELVVNWASDGSSSVNVPKATQLYMKSLTVERLPYQSWEHEFAYASGAGWKLNGEDVTAQVTDIESTDAGLFVGLTGLGIQAGDVLSVEGTFYCYKEGSVAAKYVIAESKFTWNGEAWEKYVVYTEYAVKGLDVATAGQTSNASIALKQADGTGFATSNTYKFLPGSGTGVTMNGIEIATRSISVSAKEMIIDLGVKATDGDVLAIGGTFYNVNDAVKYVVTESKFIYAGGVWSLYESNYNEVGVGEVKIVADASTEKFIYLAPVDESVKLPVNSWEDEDVFIRAYGAGVTLNGVAVEATVRSIDNCIYISLAKGVEVNDVLAISGKFICENQNALYFVQESIFVWKGQAWEKHVTYTTHEVGMLTLTSGSANQSTANAGVLQLTSKNYTFAKEEFDLLFESGIGFTVNGEQREWSVFKNHQDGYLYVSFGAVQEGDVVKIGGSFICPDKAVKYVIEESTFIWEGFWNIECEKVNVGAVTYHGPEQNMNNALHVAPLSAMKLPVTDWLTPFVVVFGNGITLNGQPINYENHVKSLGTTIFIALERDPQEGDVLVIDGTLRCVQHCVDYVFEESVLVYTNGTWVNQLYSEQAAKTAALDAHFATFTESDYYATEWVAIQEILEEAKADVEKSTTRAKVQAVYETAIAEMNAVATKASVDANFSQWVLDAKAEIAAYKDASLYRAAEQAKIAEIVAKATADIDACESSTALNKTVKEAKAALDELFTDVQWTAAEDYAIAAKDELASYKSQADYKEAEWVTIQTIIAKAYAKIDEVMAKTEAVDKAVADAKTSMDAVKTAVQVNAEQAEVATAKAELANYKKESDYNAPEWATIQSIITKANADIDEAIGDSEEIASIVESAKVKMDKVLNAEEANAKAFADAKLAVETELRNYVNNIDYGAYSDEAAAEINGYIAAAVEKIANATTYADFESVIDALKTQVESVEKIKKSGCGSVVGLAAGAVALAAVTLVLRKKKED